ncbi:ThiF family adenylyltransferase [Nonomuraea antimicrobica]
MPENDMLPDRPWVPGWYRMSTAPSGTVRLDSLTRSFAFEHVAPELLQRLLTLLDGTRPIEDIRARLDTPDTDPATVDSLLTALHANGLLRSGPPEPAALTPEEQRWWRQQADFFGHFSAASGPASSARPDLLASGFHYQSRLREAVVAVLGCGRLGSQVARDLAISGVGTLLCADDGVVGDEAARADAWYDLRHKGRPRAEVVCELVEQVTPTAGPPPSPRDPGRTCWDGATWPSSPVTSSAPPTTSPSTRRRCRPGRRGRVVAWSAWRCSSGRPCCRNRARAGRVSTTAAAVT